MWIRDEFFCDPESDVVDYFHVILRHMDGTQRKLVVSFCQICEVNQELINIRKSISKQLQRSYFLSKYGSNGKTLSRHSSGLEWSFENIVVNFLLAFFTSIV